MLLLRVFYSRGHRAYRALLCEDWGWKRSSKHSYFLTPGPSPCGVESDCPSQKVCVYRFALRGCSIHNLVSFVSSFCGNMIRVWTLNPDLMCWYLRWEKTCFQSSFSTPPLAMAWIFAHSSSQWIFVLLKDTSTDPPVEEDGLLCP